MAPNGLTATATASEVLQNLDLRGGRFSWTSMATGSWTQTNHPPSLIPMAIIRLRGSLRAPTPSSNRCRQVGCKPSQRGHTWSPSPQATRSKTLTSGTIKIRPVQQATAITMTMVSSIQPITQSGGTHSVRKWICVPMAMAMALSTRSTIFSGKNGLAMSSEPVAMRRSLSALRFCLGMMIWEIRRLTGESTAPSGMMLTETASSV